VEISEEIPRNSLEVISRAEVAAQLRVDTRTVMYWEKHERVSKGPWFAMEEALLVAAYHRLDEHLKSKDGAAAINAIPRPGTPGFEIMTSRPLYMVFGRSSSNIRLARSVAELAEAIPLDEDVRVVRLDDALAGMSAHFRTHVTTVVTGASGLVVPIRRAVGQ
jgi:hypothetical protein